MVVVFAFQHSNSSIKLYEVVVLNLTLPQNFPFNLKGECCAINGEIQRKTRTFKPQLPRLKKVLCFALCVLPKCWSKTKPDYFLGGYP